MRHNYLILGVSPTPKIHSTSLFIKREILDINFTRGLINYRWNPKKQSTTVDHNVWLERRFKFTVNTFKMRPLIKLTCLTRQYRVSRACDWQCWWTRFLRTHWDSRPVDSQSRSSMRNTWEIHTRPTILIHTLLLRRWYFSSCYQKK